MNPKTLTTSTTDSWQWEIRSGSETLNGAREQSVVTLAREGAWSLETGISKAASPSPPALFRAQQRFWRRFLHRQGIPLLQLRCYRRGVRLCGPPPRFERLLPEWHLFLNFANRFQGHQTLTRVCWAHQPPFRQWRSDCRILLAAPRCEPQSRLGPVSFRGDLLLQFLATAMEHVQKLGSRIGTWISEGPELRGWGPWEPPGYEALEEDSSQASFQSFLPQHLRLVPKRREGRVSAPWRAVAHDPRKQRLLCFNPKWPGDYACVALSKPIYRYLPEMVFGSDAHRQVIKGVQYTLPSGVLEL